MASKDCPICQGNYYAVKAADKVCESHENWLVTTCDVCGKLCFSNAMRICSRCWGSGNRTDTGGNWDPRATLRWYGQESANDYFGDHERGK